MTSTGAPWPVWLNGSAGQRLAADNRGLAYGDGLFETLSLHNGKPLRVEHHQQRLRAGCERLGLAPDFDSIWAMAEHYCGTLPTAEWAVLKLILTRRSGGRGYTPSSTECDVLLSAAPGTAPWAHDCWERGARIGALDFRCGVSSALAGIKHLNRLEQVLAAAEVAQRGLDEGLLCAEDGSVVGCTAANLLFRKDDAVNCIVHPAAGIRGTMAAQIKNWLRDTKYDVSDTTDCTLVDVLAADEVFCCNAVRGIWPVVSIDRRQFPVGALARQLQATMREQDAS